MAKPASSIPNLINDIREKIELRSGKLWRKSIDIELPLAGKTKVDGEQMAGVAEVDITPPPGVPKGGYAAMSQTAVGFRTRLKARAFYIRPSQGKSVCILQADLHGGSAIIRNKVAELVAPHTDLDAANLCLTCTHTHSGPGQLLESNFYNKFASHKPGLDPVLFEFVSKQIASAVIDAYSHAKPAKISSGTIEITGLTRNRSMVPYLNNSDINIVEANDDLKFACINPTFHLVRFDLKSEDNQYYPAGAFSNFSIHGTCIPATSDVFAADSWAYISRELELWITDTYKSPWKPVHGPSQGTHGDIAPDVKDKSIGFPEAERIGKAIAAKAITLFRSLDEKGSEEIIVQNGLRKVDLYKEPSINGVEIADTPVVGTALTAGAFEHSTPVLYHLPFFKHGMGSARFFFPDQAQGRKRRIGGRLQSLVLPKEEFPHEILFQTIRVGQFVLVGVPFEVSVQAGVDIVNEVSKSLSGDATICVASLTNGYTGYTTTAEEYEKQYYEGGHTLYGPNTNCYIAEHCKKLMADTITSQNVSDIPTSWHYDMLCSTYMEETNPKTVGMEFRWFGEPEKKTEAEESYWCFRFQGPNPAMMEWSKPLVRVEAKEAGGWRTLDDDQGYDIEVRWISQSSYGGQYECRYFGINDSESALRLSIWRDQCCLLTSPAFN